MKKLYFIRHGLTDMNVEQRAAGSSEALLTKEGRVQAKAAGEKAKELDIDYIICSPAKRAIDTAKIVAKEIGYPVKEIHINSLFAERHFGEYEGQPWNVDLDIDDVVDAEKTHEIIERSRLAAVFLHNLKAQHILVVSHGHFGRALRHHILQDNSYTGKPGDSSARIPNAEIVQWI